MQIQYGGSSGNSRENFVWPASSSICLWEHWNILIRNSFSVYESLGSTKAFKRSIHRKALSVSQTWAKISFSLWGLLKMHFRNTNPLPLSRRAGIIHKTLARIAPPSVFTCWSDVRLYNFENGAAKKKVNKGQHWERSVFCEKCPSRTGRICAHPWLPRGASGGKGHTAHPRAISIGPTCAVCVNGNTTRANVDANCSTLPKQSES
jgi:hypothetical protein